MSGMSDCSFVSTSDCTKDDVTMRVRDQESVCAKWVMLRKEEKGRTRNEAWEEVEVGRAAAA